MNGCERISMEARFARLTTKMPNGCRIWTGAQSKGGGGKEGRKKRGGPYGSFNIGKGFGIRRAHVVAAWLAGILREPKVPDGYQIDHKCKTGTLCVSCIQLIPKAENLSLPRKGRVDPARRKQSIMIARAAQKKRQ